MVSRARCQRYGILRVKDWLDPTCADACQYLALPRNRWLNALQPTDSHGAKNLSFKTPINDGSADQLIAELHLTLGVQNCHTGRYARAGRSALNLYWLNNDGIARSTNLCPFGTRGHKFGKIRYVANRATRDDYTPADHWWLW